MGQKPGTNGMFGSVVQGGSCLSDLFFKKHKKILMYDD